MNYTQRPICSINDPGIKIEFSIQSGLLSWSNGRLVIYSNIRNYIYPYYDLSIEELDMLDELQKQQTRIMCETCVHRNNNILKGCKEELYYPIEIE